MLKTNITFFYITEYQKPYVGYFVSSVKKHMPEANLVQFTDEKTPAVEGVDQVIRFPLEKEYEYSSHAETVLNILSRSPLEPVMQVDADIIFQGNVLHLMDGDYDVAICGRQPSDGTSRTFVESNKYNGGFMVHKNLRFAKEWYERTIQNTEKRLKISDEDFGFIKGQEVLSELVDSGRYKIRFLNGDIYNHTPKECGESASFAKVLHFKGPRKHWMQYYQNN